MKIAVIIEGGRIARWQLEALRAVAPGNEFVIFDCANRAPRRRSLSHGLYYALNLVAIRNPQTETVPLPDDLPIRHRVVFNAEVDGLWEALPPTVLASLRDDRPAIIVKFGMGLLRVPPAGELPCPVLSFHHGDPRRFRGRPAGFYELLNGERAIGQIVQILSNRLDAGTVVAFAETKVHPHSYRKTLMDAFRCSPLLLPQAIDNALSGRRLPIEPTGRNYRLPSNRVVARFAARMAGNKVARLLYGALWEKAWATAQVSLDREWLPDGPAQLPGPDRWTRFALPDRHRFLADPFFDPRSGAVLVEAMRSDGLGEIATASASGEARALPIEGRHLSYPATFEWGGRAFMVPESSDWSPPRLFELGTEVHDLGELDLPGRPRLLDPTPYVLDETIFLFGNRRDKGEGVLRLWMANSPFERFIEHPKSPIRISPAGSRMGGLLFDRRGKRIRPGQDLRGKYGDGLLLFRVEQLSGEDYRETGCAEIRFNTHRGPHTLNLRGDIALFDYYDDRFSLLAGIRRLRQSRAG